MSETLKRTLERMRRLFSDKAETAYTDRDAAGQSSRARSYAEGEAHAYADAEHAVRRAEEPEERPPPR